MQVTRPMSGADFARALGFCLVLAAATATGQDQFAVDRVGPPSWWTGPVDQSLLLLIEGSGLKGATARVARGPLWIVRAEAGPGGHELFAEAVVPAGSGPAPCRIEVISGGRSTAVDWDLDPPPARPADPIGPDDVIYLAMPDRFADGDPANNDPPGGGRLFDRSDTHGYHGGDFSGLRARLPYLVDLGVSALWLTPIYRTPTTWFPGNIAGTPRRMADFHGYSPVDFYDTNPRFGTPAEYKALVDQAHRLGLKVIQDQILGYASPSHPWTSRPPAPGWFHGPSDRPPSCTFRFDLAADPHATEADRRGLTDGWLFGFLPDLDVRDGRVARYAIQQSAWWATRFEADGIRLDTYPMVDRGFWRDWSRRLGEARPGLIAVGEAWVEDPSILSFFQGGRPGWDGIDPGVAMVFDFPTRAAAVAVFTGRAPASALARALANDGLYPRPDRLVTFLDNHDTPRLASEPGASPARLRLAAAFLLTSRGIPHLTWGDEIAQGGHMDDRRDFIGGFPGDRRDAFEPGGRTPEEAQLFGAYRDLLRLRRASAPLRRGTTTNLVTTRSVYAYAREHEGSRMVVALNLGDGPESAELAGLPPGPAEPVYGEGRWSPGESHPRVDLPPESATVFRVSGAGPDRR